MAHTMASEMLRRKGRHLADAAQRLNLVQCKISFRGASDTTLTYLLRSSGPASSSTVSFVSS